MPQARLKSGRSAHQAMEASAALMQVKVDGGVTDMRVLLDKLVQESLRQGLAYMETDIDPSDPTFDRKWSIKASIMSTALNIQTKVDELQLKRERNDGFDALMRRVREVEEARRQTQALVDASDRAPPLLAAE